MLYPGKPLREIPLEVYCRVLQGFRWVSCFS